MKSKKESYEVLLQQITSLIEGESNTTAILANICAAIHEEMGFFWTGFYLVDGEELVLGPFQGPVACFRIKKGRGVCGTAWQEERTLVVPDVEQFKGHIACSSLSRSEIVVPVMSADNEVLGVLDIDSKELGTFDATDALYLEKVVEVIASRV